MPPAVEDRSEAARSGSPLTALDHVVLTGLLLLLGAYLGVTVDFSRYPEEDAAMLLRYSRHLGDGRGIVWNVGEAPVDGATDFLFMILVAGLFRAGLSLPAAAQTVGVAAHALTVAAVFLALRTAFGGNRSMAALAAAFLAVGVGPRYVAAGYGTPLFALMACVTWWLAGRLIRASGGRLARDAVVFAFCGVTLGLARPEGVFLAAFMLLAVLAARAGQGARTILSAFAAAFLTVGLAYFLWRWHYFGYPLPNPFYKKGGGRLHWPALLRAFRDLHRLGGPFVWILGAGLLFTRSRRAALTGAIPLLGYTLLWVLVSDETNYFMRFRYPILPVLLLSWAPVWGAIRDGLGAPAQRLGASVLVLLLTAAVGLQHERYHHLESKDSGLHDAAVVLREYRDRGYTLVTTEAGLLPLYSEWKAVDAWGLNDAFVAHRGGLTPAYLDARQPELILVHAYSSPGVSESAERAARHGLPGWSGMVATIEDYAHARAYRLAAAFVKNAYDSHYYYVRRDFPDAGAIVRRIRALDYYWDGDQLHNVTEERE